VRAVIAVLVMRVEALAHRRREIIRWLVRDDRRRASQEQGRCDRHRGDTSFEVAEHLRPSPFPTVAIPWPSTCENEGRAGERASPARTTPVALDLGGLRRPELRPERVIRESARGDRFGA